MVELALSGFQREIAQHMLYGKEPWLLLPGGAGSGKTFGATLGLVLRSQIPSIYPRLVTGLDLSTVVGNTRPGIEHWCDAIGLSFRYHPNPATYFVGGVPIEIRGLADESSYKRIQGRTYVDVLIDELTTVAETAWDMLLTRLRAPGAKGVATWNKLGPRHWTKLRVRDNLEALGGRVMESLPSDNPTLPQEFLDRLQAGGGLAQHQYSRLVLNLDASPDGRVYPHWLESNLLFKGAPCYVGVDYGESGVTAAVYAQAVNGGGETKWVVVGEYYYDGKRQGKRDSNRHAQAIKEAAPGRIMHAWVDPTARDLKASLRRARVAATNAYTDLTGYDITNGMLQRGEMVINDRRCPSLATEVEDLVYQRVRGVTVDRPDPACQDHATDCLRYVACGLSAIRRATSGAVRRA